MFQPTKEQQAVKTAFQNLMCFHPMIASIFLNSVAGSGKTSTIMLMIKTLQEMSARFKRPVKACSVSFNRIIATTSQAKINAMGSSVRALTTNSLGRSMLLSASEKKLCAAPQEKADGGKYTDIAKKLLEEHKYNLNFFPKPKHYREAVHALCTLVEGTRSTRTTPTPDSLLELVFHYELGDKVDVVAPYFGLICGMVAVVIKEGIEAYNDAEIAAKYSQQIGWHDFNDQICLPIDLDIVARDWDIIFIDEAQDLNRARLDLLTRAVSRCGLLFFVGDPFQAIQGFTFADTQSVKTIIQRTKATSYSLSLCWRCPKDVITLAQAIVPHIQADPNADKGTIEVVGSYYLDSLQEGSVVNGKHTDPTLVLSRTKAPLAIGCLAAIRAGKSAIIRGRDIGSGLVKLVGAICGDKEVELKDFLEEMAWYREQRLLKLAKKVKAETEIANFCDQIETIEALFDGYEGDDLEGFKNFIGSKFADDDTQSGDHILPIIFSTVHKAKGLEYDEVMIIEPQLFPHPMANPGWQLEQEYNILYVAVTRAKKVLRFAGGIPLPLAAAYADLHPVITEIVYSEVVPVGLSLPLALVKELEAYAKATLSDETTVIAMALTQFLQQQKVGI